MSARLGGWLALGALIIGALVWVAWPSGGAAPRAERTAGLVEEIQCPECDGLSVADSPSDTARAIRRDIRARVERGQSDDEIRTAYVEAYGESILLEPEGSGLGMLVWGLPLAALIVGAAGLTIALRRWGAQPRVHATEADEKLVTAERRSP
jgi:cytochrome c-type biogenesis protein CcmH